MLYEERNEYGYTAIEVEEAVDDVYVYAKNSNNTNEYVPVNLYWISYEDIQTCYDKIQEEDHFEDIFVTQDHIQASITIHDENKTVMTTLPYNPGWTVTIDGKKVKTKIVNSAMLGFDLTAGKHQIEFDFKPNGLLLGGSMSVISLGIVFFILVKGKRAASQISKSK